MFALAQRVDAELGPVVVHTGSRVPGSLPHGIVWPAPVYDNRSFRTRAVTWARYLVSALVAIARIPGRPVLLVSTNPPLLPLLALMGKRWRGWPYLVQVLDVYPDVLVSMGLCRPNHLLFRWWAALNGRIYREAARVVTLGEVMAEKVSPYMPPTGKVDQVPFWVDTNEIRPLPKADNWFARRHGLVDKLTVLYSGNLGLTHELEGLFTAVETFGTRARLCLLVIGGGASAARVQRRLQRLPAGRHLPYQPRRVLPYSLAAADVGVVTLGKGMGGISMPSKCYYLMAAGCALLALTSDDNDLRRIVEKYKCGINVDTKDVAGIRHALSRFRQDPAFLHRCRRNARRAAEEHFSAEVCMPWYLNTLRAMQTSRDTREEP